MRRERTRAENLASSYSNGVRSQSRRSPGLFWGALPLLVPFVSLNLAEDRGKNSFYDTLSRYWQEGGGYDRNMFSRAAIMHAIDYIHENPLRRKLCSKLDAWRWSSYRYYASEGQVVDEALPKIEPLSAEYLLALDG
jgi:hypothetical protein